MLTPSLHSSQLVRPAVFVAAGVHLVYLLVLTTFVDNAGPRVVVASIILIIAGLLATGALWYAAYTTGAAGSRVRQAWLLLALAQLFTTLGDTVWGLADLAGPAQPVLAEALHLVYYPLFALGLMTLPAAPATRAERLRLLLDMAILMVGTSVVLWAFWFGPEAAVGGLSAGRLFYALAYPVGNTGLFFVLVILLLRRHTHGRLPLLMLAGSVLILVVTDMLFGRDYVLGEYARGGWLEMGWLLSYTCLGLAGMLQAAESTSGVREIEPGLSRSLRRWLPWLPYALLAVVYLLLLWGSAQRVTLSDSVLGFSVGGIMLLVLLRQVVAIHENERLLRAEQRRREADTVLLALSRELLAAPDESAVAQGALRVATTALQGELGLLGLAKPEGELCLAASAGWPADAVEGLRFAPGSGSQTGYTVERGQPVVVADYGRPQAFVVEQAVQALGLASGLSVPMFLDDRAIGAVLIYSRAPRAYTDDEVRLLALIANQAAAAIDRARLFEVRRRQYDELTVLHAVATAGAEAVSEDQLIERVTDIVAAQLDWSNIGVLLVDREAGRLRTHPSYHGDANFSTALGQGITGHVALTGQPARVGDTGLDPRYIAQEAGIQSELCVPMLAGEQVIGVLNVESDRLNAFGEADQRLVTTIARQLATALEKLRLFERLFQAEQQRAGELEAVRQASLGLTASLDLQAVLRAILQSALKLVPSAQEALVFLYHREGGGRLTYGASRSRTGEVPHAEAWLPRPSGLTSTVARTGELVIISDMRQHPLFVEAPAEWGGAIISLPLRIGARVVGVMNVTYPVPRIFPDSELRVLRLLGDQAAIAIENARLFQAERAAREQAEALREVAATLNTSLDRQGLLQLILEQLARVVRFDSASVMLFNGDRLAIVAQRGFHTSAQANIPDNIGPLPHLAEVIDSRQPLIITDTTSDARWQGMTGTEYIRCWLGVPLVAQGRVIGLLNLDHEQVGYYTERDAELASVFANQAAVAIENVRLFEGERRQLGLAQTLQSVGALLTAQMGLQEVFENIFDLLAQVVEYDSVAVQLVTPDGGMELAAGRGFPDMEAARENIRYVGERRRSEQWLQHRLMVISDIESDPRWIRTGGTEYVRSWIGAALVVKGKLVGLLTTDSATPNAYNSMLGETVQAFANQAAVAIENARLFEASQRQTQALAGLYNTALATGSVLETDMLLTRFFEQVRELLNPDSFSVAFFHGDSDELEVVSAVEDGRATDDLPMGRLPVSHGLTGWVTRLRRSLVINDLQADPLPVPPREGLSPARSWLGVPLIARDRNLGVVSVQSFRPGAFDTADQRFLESVASQVAIAIENARLYAEVSARANELSRLYAAAQDLGAKLEPRAVLEQLAKHLTEAVDATSGYVVEVNLSSEHLTVLAEYCTPAATTEERAGRLGKVYALADHPTINRAVTRLSVMELQADGSMLTGYEHDALRRVGVKSALVVPIVARGEVLGEAEIWESRRVRVFSLAERRMLQTLCQHAAGVIENARLFAETLQHADEVTTASEILHLLNATANVVESFPLIAAAIKSITGCERVSMAMLDSRHTKVTVVALDRARAELPRGVQFPVTFTAAATDVLAGHIHLTPNLEAELGYPAERQLYEAGFRSRLTLPLRVGAQIIGSLNLVWREVSGYMQANLPLLTQLVDAVALAVEKTRLLDETRRRDAILEALAYASGALLLPGDPDEVMPNLLAQLGQAAGVSRASIFYNQVAGDGTVYASLRHEWIAPGQTAKRDDPEWQNLPYAAGGFERWQQTLSAGQTLDGLVRDFPASERLRLERQAVLSLAVVPIVSEGEWWGWLGFDDCQTERIWSGAEIEALKNVAGALGAYLARQRIETAEREQRTLAEALRDAAAVLSSTLDLDEVLDRILTDVGHVVPHESANIMLLEEGVARVVRNRDVRGSVTEHPAQATRFPVAEVPNLRHMLETGQPAIVVDTQQFVGWMDTPATRWIRSNVGAPIQIKGQVIGFITLDNTTPGFFSLAHAERLQAFAQQAGLAIENAQLYASIRQHAEELEQRVDARTRELAQANERLQELDRLKDQIISNVSHELRTPLTNIKLHLGLLEKRGAEVLGRYLPTLQRETERLRRLIEDLLDLSRLQTQPQTVRRDFHALDDLLSEVLTVHAARAEAKGLALHHELSPTAVAVPVDRAQMIQVFNNLIGNAVAYTPAGGRAVVSSLEARIGSRHGVIVRFHNDGPTIPPEDLPHLFRPFYRGRTAQDSGEPGTGLGLAICREIIEHHGGQIEATSSAVDGTTFEVWLPLS